MRRHHLLRCDGWVHNYVWPVPKYGWPLMVFGLISLLTYRSLVHTELPTVEFYRISAEVIPLLLLAAMVERETFSRVRGLIRGEFIVVLAFAEVAALLAVSGLFVPNNQKHAKLLVGGTTVGTNLLACMIGTGLVGAAILVGCAIAGKQSGTASVADDLKKLAGLRSDGSLTEEEFEALKQRLLAG